MMMDVRKAIGLIDQIIKLHSGHIDGSVKATQESMEKEMALIQGARAALTGTPSTMPMRNRLLMK